MTDIDQVHRKSMAAFQLALQQEALSYRQAEASGDVDSMADAASRMAGLRASMRELGTMRSEIENANAHAEPPNPHGLSADEVEIAKLSGISDEQYAINKRRMNVMKDQGYWSQGRVFK